MASSFQQALRKDLILLRRVVVLQNEVVKRFRTSKVTELFPQRLVLPDHGYTPILAPSQVTSLLSINETSLENGVDGTHLIKGYYSNQLGSNFPCEDRRSQARLVQTRGTLHGVFDGHGGIACAQAVSERLYDYIAVSLLPHDKLEELSHAMKTDKPMKLLRWHRNANDYSSDEMSYMYRSNLQKFVVETLSLSGLEEIEADERISEALRTAFQRLDNDISAEALPSSGALNLEAVEVAMSGACGCVAHINKTDLYVANLGDTRAVLGQINESGDWVAKPMSSDHNTSNEEEVKRVRDGHPISENISIMRNDRLLGQLIPLRAFGDFRYKWSLQDLKNVVKILDTSYAASIIPQYYYTPPYLTNVPEVRHHQITSSDKFLVIASDGLWDMLDNQRVVQLIGEYIEGKETKENFKLRKDKPVRLGSLNKHLLKRKAGLANKSQDTNAATHLIRHALGADHHKVSEMLTLPPEVVRYYRDDITVTVIFFDSDYIKQS